MQHNGKSFRWRRRVHLNDTPSDPFETKKDEKTVHARIKIRPPTSKCITFREIYVFVIVFIELYCYT